MEFYRHNIHITSHHTHTHVIALKMYVHNFGRKWEKWIVYVYRTHRHKPQHIFTYVHSNIFYPLSIILIHLFSSLLSLSILVSDLAKMILQNLTYAAYQNKSQNKDYKQALNLFELIFLSCLSVRL